MTTDNFEIVYDDKFTRGQAEVSHIKWKVKSFKNFLINNKTKEFRTKMNKDPTNDTPERNFHLKMEFLGRNNDVIQLYYLSPNTIFSKSSLQLLINYSDEHSLVENEYKTIQANTWEHLATITKLQINNDTNQFLNKYGYLSLLFKFIVATNVTVDTPNVPEARLSNDLEELLNDETFSDVTIKSAEGSEYKVHKAVIASRSAVLKANFLHSTTECNTNIIESPFSADVLQEVLMFIYSDKVPKVDEIPEKLLAAADYYQLNRLKILCEESLHKKLTFENAIGTLQLANLHSANHLKELTMEFIKNGQKKLITKTDGWLQAESAKLIKDIYEYIIFDDKSKDSEDIMFV